MRYLSLFGLRIRHDYHPDGTCGDLQVLPSVKTRRLMDRHRLRLQQLPDGLSVAAASDSTGPLIALPHNEVFEFELGLRDPAFAHFTDLQAHAGLMAPVYRNVPDGGTALQLGDSASWHTESWVAPARARKATFVLAGNPLPREGKRAGRAQAVDFELIGATRSQQVVAYDAAAKTITVAPVRAQQRIVVRYRTRPVPGSRRLATVELRYHPGMPAPGRADAPFEIRFQARAARWAYYLVTDRPGDFSIVDTRPSGRPLGFSASNRTVLDDDASSTDPCAGDLARQYAGMTRIRFLSDQPVPCARGTRRGIELRLAGDTVMPALPTPPAQHAFRIRRGAGSALPDEDLFHQVVRYLKSH